MKISGKANINNYIKDKPHLRIVEIKPKARYIYLLGSKKQNKEMMSVLKSKIKPYIKR